MAASKWWIGLAAALMTAGPVFAEDAAADDEEATVEESSAESLAAWPGDGSKTA